MNPRTRFRETVQPLLDELTISPVGAKFHSTGECMDQEFIHLDIAGDGTALENRLRETGWQHASTEPDTTTYRLCNEAVELVLRTRVSG
jgi:hypothetical protein